MISDRTLKQVVATIHSFSELEGCVIGFHGNGQSQVLHSGYSATANSERVIVIVEECILTEDSAVVTELRRWAEAHGGSPENSPNPVIVTNRSRIGPELIGAGFSCGLTIVSAFGVAGGVAGEIPTGGASTFLLVASWTGLVTQGIQCANGLVRVAAIAGNLDGNTLEQWDNNRAYSCSILLVDTVGVVTGVASLPFAARNLWAVISRQRGFLQKGLTLEVLRRMNRAERLRAISEVFEEASRTPEGRTALIKAAREAGIGPQTIQYAKELSVSRANTVVRIVSDETIRRLSASLREVISGVAGILGSATPASWSGSASGSVNWIINVVHAGASKDTVSL